MSAPLRLGADPRQARALCVLVHGRGASPESMAGLARAVGGDDVAFALPRASGGVWYPARAVEPLSAATAARLEAVLDQVDEAARTLRVDHGDLPLLVAGFSQGACVALEYALRRGPWAGALAVLTGCRVGAPTPGLPVADLAGMPAYLSGADADQHIPIFAVAGAVLALGQARARLRVDLFPGRDHTVSSAEVGALAGILRDLVAGREWGLSQV